jgi:hypothetical protein
MAENTVNESTEYRITSNSGGEIVFYGEAAVADFAMKTSVHAATMLRVIAESNSEPLFKEDALDAVVNLAWQLQQATSIVACWSEEVQGTAVQST